MPVNRPTQFGKPNKTGTPKTSAQGRVCAADGCRAILSIYNDSAHCAPHAQPEFRFGGRRS